MRVLVADDQQSVRAVVREVLTDAGHEVVAEAADGRGAYALVCSERPDVVLLDLTMPEVDGIAALRLIRERDQAVRVVVHTGHSDAALSLALAEAGADAVVVKGGDPAPLLAAISQLSPSARSTSAA